MSDLHGSRRSLKAEEAAVRSHSVRDKAQVAPCPSSAMRLRSSTWGSRVGGELSADIGSRGLREERNVLSTDFTDDTDSGPRFQIRGRYLLRVPPPGLPMPSRLPAEECLPGIQRASGTTSGSFAPVLTLPLLLGASAGMLLIPLPLLLRASEGTLPIPCRTVPRGEPASSRRQDSSRIQQWIVAIRGRNPSPWP